MIKKKEDLLKIRKKEEIMHIFFSFNNILCILYGMYNVAQDGNKMVERKKWVVALLLNEVVVTCEEEEYYNNV